jgi:hypothetical protein
MNKTVKLFMAAVLAVSVYPGTVLAASCSRANLNRCLDSVCAINISANPAARCQLCGTSQAGVAPADTGMKNLSLGTSARYSISDKELRSAPTDPGTRYAWAMVECMKKVAGCTKDNAADAADAYDKLIEQSCKAAGISNSREALLIAASKPKDSTVCANDIRNCLMDAKHCDASYAKCKENSDFDKFFSACAVSASGCGDYVATIRTDLLRTRDNVAKNQETLLANIVQAYRTARETRKKTAEESCRNGGGKEACVQTVCATNMKNNCAAGFESEKSMATLLCAFHDTACQRLK